MRNYFQHHETGCIPVISIKYVTMHILIHNLCLSIMCHMQYKFFVDGEWKHDEHQPLVNGEIGIANTIFLATDPNFIPRSVSPEISSGSNMDVDNEAFRRLVRVGHF